MSAARHTAAARSAWRATSLVVAIAVLAMFSCEGQVPIPGCSDEREFKPMAKPNATDDDVVGKDEKSEARASGGGTTDDSTKNPTAANTSLDGGTGSASVEATSSSEMTATDARAFLALLQTGLPKPGGKLFKALCRECANLKGCADGGCRTALASCDGPADCAAALSSSCPAFQTQAKGVSGDQLAKKADFYVRDLWGEMVVKARLALTDKQGEALDAAAERYGL